MMLAMAGNVDLILEALAGAPGGLTRPELLGRLREKIPYLQAAEVDRVVKSAGERVRIIGDRFHVVIAAEEMPVAPLRTQPRRFVAFDLESIVRPIVKDPYREQHVFQLGAVRFGPDNEWVAEQREFSSFTALSSESDELLIYRDNLRSRYHAEKQPLAEVLTQFRLFLAGADVVVAYNGVAHDFRLIDEECGRCGVPTLLVGPDAPRLVDALYLAQALWPIPPRQHRLKELLERLEIDVEEMQWHDALDDSKMVVELLGYGASEFLPSLGTEFVALLAAAGAGSDAWKLLFGLAGVSPQTGPHDHARTARILLVALQRNASKKPLRPEPDGGKGQSAGRSPEPFALTISDTIRGDDGRVSIEKLVAAVKGPAAEPRPAQRTMVAKMREWVGAGAPGSGEISSSATSPGAIPARGA